MDWSVLSSAHWRGLGNYSFLLTADPVFMHSLLVTVILAVGSAVIGIPVALLLAITLTASKNRTFWRTIFWLPALTNIVAVGYAWQNVLDPTYGAVNRSLSSMGIVGPDWLTEPVPAVMSTAIVMAWLTLGHNILLFSTGIEAIDPSLAEAASSDGADERQIFWHITLPLLRPTTMFVLISNLISGMGSFALILVLTDGGPNNSTMVTALYLYRMAFESLRMGRASAAAIILSVITLTLSLLQLRLFSRKTEISP